MKKYLLIPTLLVSAGTFAQIPEDVLRNSFFPQNGTARSLAIGGAMGSLGGDISATFVNPAGLGNYKTGEAVFTPSFFLNNNSINFRETGLKNNKNSFSLGTIGFVYGDINENNRKNSYAISLAFTQQANYNNRLQYRGYNNYSSFSEQWAEQVSNSGLSIDGVLGSPQYAFGSAPALYTYLVDTFRVNGNLQVKALPEFVLESGKALLQENTIDTRGGLYELALGLANNINDKWQFGGTLGLPILNYTSSSTFTETDTSSNKTNGFDYFKYRDEFNTKGVGVNLKLGVIYRPKEYIRLGLAIHTPSYFLNVKDTRSTYLEANTENYNGFARDSSFNYSNGAPGISEYSMLTPWRVMLSGSFVFREVENVKKQRGFITADIEYVRHRGSSFASANENTTPEENKYYDQLNEVVKNQYKGAFNFRVGGEVKFNVIMARLGFAYYGNPYKDEALNASKLLLSGGLGYRHKGFFVDLTYVHSINKDVNFPYRLGDKSNTFAEVNNTRGNIIASVGFKF